MLDAEGFVTEWTGSARRVKGYAPEEVLGRHDSMFYAPEAVGRATQSWGVCLRSMRERAEMLGGTLRLNTAPGAGTRAEVRVPLDGRR